MTIKPSWGQNQPSVPSQDTVTGVVSGKDHSTGSSLVAVTGARSPILSNDGSGSRVGNSVSLRVISASSGGRTAQITGFSSSSGAKKVTSSATTRSITNPSALKPECTNSPAPPKKDPPEKDPEEPGKPPQGDGPIPPPIPAPSAEPPTQGDPGCEPQSNTKWFTGSCPPGTQSLGSATLADGSTRSLCKGPSGKPTGCESPAKWICDSTIGTCIKSSTGGGYDSYEACMGAGCKRLRFSCVDGKCVESEGGVFPTYDACINSGCTPVVAYLYRLPSNYIVSLNTTVSPAVCIFTPTKCIAFASATLSYQAITKVSEAYETTCGENFAASLGGVTLRFAGQPQTPTVTPLYQLPPAGLGVGFDC